jgi:hypothetical protein
VKINNSDLGDDDEDDFLRDIGSDDEDQIATSEHPGFDAIDPEYTNRTAPSVGDREEDMFNADGTLKTNWQEIAERIEKRKSADRAVRATEPGRSEPPPLPEGDLVAFEARPGNYILAVGLPGSGKTALQSHILHYLFKSGTYYAGSDPDPKREQSQLATLAYWKQCWREKIFPESTQLDRADHFRYVIRTKGQDLINRRFKFGFIEVSGEHMRRVEDGRGEKPELPAAIHRMMANKKCRIVFLLVCNAEKDPWKDDDFFQSFINYFNFHTDIAFRKDTAIAFVLANPKAAQLFVKNELKKATDKGKPNSQRNNDLLKLTEDVSQAQAPGDLLARVFLHRVLKKTRNSLRGWDGPKRAFGFAVGETFYDSNKQRPIIVSYDFSDASRIFKWVYRQTTRVQLPKPFNFLFSDDSDD